MARSLAERATVSNNYWKKGTYSALQ
jgi:hypothetical protein